MSTKEVYETLIQELGYAESPGLVLSIPWHHRQAISEVDAVYLAQDVPVVYFSRLAADDEPLNVWNLYRKVWNESKVPLLVVVFPQEIRVYNTFADPVNNASALDDDSSRLLRCIRSLTGVISALEIREKLSDYKRLQFDTRTFWTTKDGQKVQRSKRADQRLLMAMDEVRLSLARNLTNYTAYALLGRSIFIRYLEDREILTPSWILELTDGKANDYRSALKELETTYLLFSRLSDRFNGDLFPVDLLERQSVTGEHLSFLEQFLAGTVKGQLSFWPFDFNYIPIELISGIYDTFLSSKKQKELGAYYTPLPLVDFVIEETLPKHVLREGYAVTKVMTVLDPACGSGVFLVRAYQRLVVALGQPASQPFDASQLAGILKQSIFGVDKSPEAVRIAAFSLYLAMMDYLEKEEILAPTFRFPSLYGSNLLVADFFSPKVNQHFAGQKFLRIVGNPPWGRGTLKGESAAWVSQAGYPVGEKQIVQAFLWRVPEFCADEGEIALLAPAKSTILVSRHTHDSFRRQFFESYKVRAVVNLTSLVYELFDDSLSPAIVLFYETKRPIYPLRIAVGVPKPSPLSKTLAAIVLDATEVKFLDYEELLNWPTLWKVALWGSPRDASLIKRLQSWPTLEEQAERLNWKIYVGYEAEYPRSAQNYAPWLKGLPLVSPRRFRAYLTNPQETVRKNIFHRSREEEAFQGPLVLIRRSACQAAFRADPVAYRNKMTGIVGQAESTYLLKWLTAFINTPLAKYYHFLTSTSWAVERGTIIHDEYKQMPFFVPDENDSRLQQVLSHFDKIVEIYQQHDAATLSIQGVDALIRDHEAAIAELVFDLFELTSAERQLVRDMIDYGIDYFHWSKRKSRKPQSARAVKPPDTPMLIAYAQDFVETATAFLRYQDKSLNAYVYQNGAPLTVIEFEAGPFSNGQQVKVIKDSAAVGELLRDLSRWLIEQRSPDIYMRRHLRIYQDSRLYLVRPCERRFWTRSQARADADDFIVDLLSQP